jgi:hypothetical protein
VLVEKEILIEIPKGETMGWGCYRHEVDAGSENWEKKLKSLIPNGRSHGKPFDWGRDGQVCPFCWEELEAVNRIYSKALAEINEKPEAAGLIATQAFEEAEKIELHPVETEK